jgi:uncharacterized protein (DUF1800 family)
VGPGTYQEEDVQELARAWTGWFVLRNELKYFPREFDGGRKRILGQVGDWTAQDALRIALDQPHAVQLIVRRLYRWLVSETDEPGDPFLQPLYETFGKEQDTRAVVEQILRSNWFFSTTVYRRRVKSPVEFAVGLIRAMEATVPTIPLAKNLAGLGQNLYAPPTLGGWAGGMHWINPATMIGRANLAATLLSGSGPYGGKLDPAKLAGDHGHPDAAAATQFVARLLLQTDARELPEGLRGGADAGEANGGFMKSRLRAFTHRLAASAEFQLA